MKNAPETNLRVTNMSTSKMVSEFARTTINYLSYAIHNRGHLTGKEKVQQGCMDQADTTHDFHQEVKNYLNKNKCLRKDEKGELWLEKKYLHIAEGKNLLVINVKYCFCDDKDLCNGIGHARPEIVMAVLVGLLLTFGVV